jgi:hypothetical protein
VVGWGGGGVACVLTGGSMCPYTTGWCVCPTRVLQAQTRPLAPPPPSLLVTSLKHPPGSLAHLRKVHILGYSTQDPGRGRSSSYRLQGPQTSQNKQFTQIATTLQVLNTGGHLGGSTCQLSQYSCSYSCAAASAMLQWHPAHTQTV